jgi:hypothetical protein
MGVSQVGYGAPIPGSAGYAYQMGVSGVGIAPIASSTVSMGTTTIAPTIYEKAIVQDIPSTYYSNGS